MVAVFVLVLLAGAPRGRWWPLPPGGTWLPRAVVASAAIALLALAVANPDALIARYNVTRFEETGKLDTRYLDNLSADAVPVLTHLPEPQRSCALDRVAENLDTETPWHAVNVARVRARHLIDQDPVNLNATCPVAGG